MKKYKDIIGLNIEHMMEMYGFTQEELSIETGISQSAICQYINGNRMPKADILYEIAQVLECKMEEFFDESILDEEEP